VNSLTEMKENARAFYDPMFNQCKPREVVDRYVGAEYTQHNPEVGDGVFRFDEQGKIVEHWDVLQVIPESSKNDNGMFWTDRRRAT